MKKILKIVVSAVLSVAAIILISRFVGGVYADGIDSFEKNINSEVEAKRAELLETGVFREGVSVSGVAIGGMTYEEAKRALIPVEESMIKDVGFTVVYGDGQQLVIDRSYFDISYDTEDVLGEAIMLASDGEYEELRQEIDDIAANGRAYTISCIVSAKEDAIEEDVRTVGDSLFVEPVNASIIPNPDSVYDDSDRFTYDPGVNGYIAKTDEAIDEIISRARSHAYGTVYMEGMEIEPEIKVEDIEGSVVFRAGYKSSYNSGAYARPSRVFNIIKACGLVNGTVLPPKDPDDPDNKDYIFSCEATLGPRTEALGWQLAPGFIDGGAGSKDSPGGGVCHVSSTLYNAVICSDLKIVYRINHSAHVGYVPWGQDATIDTGKIDFKFANNTNSNIYVFMWVDQSKKLVCAEIWGEPFPERFDEIRFYAELVEEIPPTATQYIQDSKLRAPYWYVANKAKTGYKYQSYKQYYKHNRPVGEPIPVALSTYNMHPMRIHVWKGYDASVDVLDPAYKIDPPED